MKKALFAFLGLSLAGNIALALRLAPSAVGRASPARETSSPTTSSDARGGTATNVAAQPTAVASRADAADIAARDLGQALRAARSEKELRTVADQMRAAGFPSKVIHATVSELIRGRFATREPREAFWRHGQPSPEAVAINQQLASERRALLETVLGPDALPSATLDSHAREQRYGRLTDDQLNAVVRIERDYDELRAKSAAERGANFMSRLASGAQQEQLLEAEKMRDLAAFLSPEELEAYELRNSKVARSLGMKLSALTLAEEEFKQLYQLQKAFEEKHTLLPNSGIDQLSARMEAQTELNAEARRVLSDDRYYSFLEANDPGYAAVARFTAPHANISPQQTLELYLLQSRLQRELFNSSRTSPNATRPTAPLPDFQAYQIKLVEILGPDLAKAYQATNGPGRMFAPMGSVRSTGK